MKETHMAQAARCPLASLRSKKLEAEIALRLARLRELQTQKVLRATTGPGEVAKRVLVGLARKDVALAEAELALVADALENALARLRPTNQLPSWAQVQRVLWKQPPSRVRDQQTTQLDLSPHLS
jgi:hypothetical protein